MARFPYAKTFLLGFGFFGISVIWPIFNNFVPIFLAEMGLRAALVGFVMTWDNYLNMFVQPIVGERSDHTRSRLGRRKPWMLVGAPIAATAFLLIPSLHTVIGIMLAILLTNLGMALFRSPTVALLGDLYLPEQRSTANGVINLMGGVGAIVAFLGGGALYAFGRITPFLFGSLILLGAIPPHPPTLHRAARARAFCATCAKYSRARTARGSGSWPPLYAGSWASMPSRPGSPPSSMPSRPGSPPSANSRWALIRAACR